MTAVDQSPVMHPHCVEEDISPSFMIEYVIFSVPSSSQEISLKSPQCFHCLVFE
jgi:hypothetical protein